MGKLSKLSTPQNLMRYDVEVSGFPSSHTGHLVLLHLTEDDYPNTKRIEDWPSWDLPILQWGKKQGGVVGFAHSGWGLSVKGDRLPIYDLPPFDGIGANEFIVDVTHDACDFISAVDTPSTWELNIWYHTLNCGFTTRISGETDFPCIYDEQVGLGRVYVKMNPNEPLEFDSWVRGVRDGRSYCCDGRTHLIDFEVGGLAVGEPGDRRPHQRVGGQAGAKIENPMSRCWSARRATDSRRHSHSKVRPKALLEHRASSREGHRQVPVELIVNGEAVDKQMIDADGQTHDVEFEFTPQRSSWIALRVFPAAHTNPVFVEVDGAPIRASKRSAKWCLDAVDRCWESKKPKIRESELPAAEEAYEHARKAYRQVLEVAFDDAPKK